MNPAEPGSFDESKAWEELIKLADKLEHVYDPTIKGALAEALQAKVAKLGPKLTRMPWAAAQIGTLRARFPTLEVEPEPEPQSDEESGSGSGAQSEESTQSDRAGAARTADPEELLRRAHVAAVRGEKDESKRLLDEAVRAAPDSPAVLEAVADSLREQGKLKEAFDLYARIIQTGPRNVSVEKKHAELAFRITGAASAAYLSNVSEIEAMASAKAAVWLSLFFPGLGQIVAGRTSTGIAFMGAWILSWILVWWIGFDNILIPMGLKSGGEKQNINMAAFVFLASAALSHLMAIFDAASRAGGRRPPPERPLPPADLPFE